jgi:transcriptional regulator with XRE-family HTH domain
MINLAYLRRMAELSQEQMAELLHCSQAQICRYELKPEEVSFKTVVEWARLCGVDSLSDALQSVETSAPPIDPGTPYSDFDKKVRFLLEFVTEAYPKSNVDIPGVLKQKELAEGIKAVWRKPHVVLAGEFDAGKSRFANALFSKDQIPSSYTPTTKVITYVRHLAERPLWLKEEVLILDTNFDPTKWRDQEHCYRQPNQLKVELPLPQPRNECCYVQAGGFDLLRKEIEGAAFALAYVDAPILHACTLIDLPGFNEEENKEENNDGDRDEDIVRKSAYTADVLVYLSSMTGFLNRQDLLRLGQMVRVLPMVRQGIPNLFVVASHAHPAVKDLDLQKTLDDRAQEYFD